LELREEGADAIGLPGTSVDAVVSTLVMCTSFCAARTALLGDRIMVVPSSAAAAWESSEQVSMS
jgi:hypothetical protein